MKKTARILLIVIYIALIPLAFFMGLRVASKSLEERILPSLAETMEYNSSIYNAANYARLLLAVREGDIPGAIQRLEHLTDVSILMASANTNALVQGIPDGPWEKLKEDRLAYPRQTTADRETRIRLYLDTMIQERPQQSGGAYVSPAAGSPSAHP